MDLLIDGDIATYGAGFAADKEVRDHGGDGLVIALANAKKHVMGARKYLEETFHITATYVFLTATDKSNFRYDVAKTQPYHGNRVSGHKPVYYNEIREYFTRQWGALVVSGREADDEMGAWASQNPRKSIIFSADKDMRMIPGWHYEGHEKDVYFVSDPGYLFLDARKSSLKLMGTGYAWFCAQLLMGDRADNIPGLPGIGDIKAYEILHKFKDQEDLDRRVLQAYTNLGLQGRLQEIKDLLWIHRT